MGNTAGAGALVKKAADLETERKKEAASGNLAAASAAPGSDNPGLDAKARGIRGGVHYTPDPETSKASYSMAHEARKDQ